MTISVKHKFNNTHADGTDTSIVRPSNWNDEHDLTIAANRLFGRYAGTSGAAQEVKLGASMRWNVDAIDTNNVAQVAYFASSSAPTGWLKANGALISRTTYADLFAAIGTTYGAGDGSTTFALPDLRGEFLRGFDDGRGVDTSRVLGSAQTDQNQAHNHTITDPGHAHSISDAGHNHGLNDPGHAHSVYDPGHSHTFSARQNVAGGTFAVAINANSAANNNIGTTAVGTGVSIYGAGTGCYNSASGTGIGIVAHATGITIANNGGSEARPRNIALLACIKY